MENSNLLLIYLGILLALLGVAAFFVVRQVIKTRRIETTLGRLQSQLGKEKGTAQEYYELGSLLLDKKLYTQAALYLQQALKQLDDGEIENAAVVYNALGYAYFAQDQYDLTGVRHGPQQPGPQLRAQAAYGPGAGELRRRPGPRA